MTAPGNPVDRVALTDHARPLAAGQPYTTQRRVLAGIPCMIERPDDDTPLKALTLVLHGAYDSKEGKLGVYSALCAGGVAVVIPDAALHGERADTALTPEALSPEALSPETLGERNYVWTAAARTSHSTAALIDALHAEFGPLPIWAVGSSMGGYTAQFLAMHERRVSRVACLISAGVWDDPQATTPEARAYLEGFRPIDHARLAPPTALFLQNGSDDPLFSPEAVERTAAAYRSAYAAAGCPQNFRQRIYQGVAHYTSVGMRDDAVSFLLEDLPQR